VGTSEFVVLPGGLLGCKDERGVIFCSLEQKNKNNKQKKTQNNKCSDIVIRENNFSFWK
jgi:hypothetical protein